MFGFFEEFQAVVASYPDRCAIELQRPDALERVSYQELSARVDAAALSLQRRGAQPGQRWAILAENSIAWCAVALAMNRLGLAAVPLDTNYRAEQVGKLLADCGASGLVVSAESAELAQEATSATPIPLLSLDAFEPLEQIDFGLTPTPAELGAPHAAKEDETALILYTSGTTHDPKGVVLTNGNLSSICTSAQAAVGMTEEDSVLSVLPLFHALAHVANLALPLRIGARAVFMDTVNTPELLRALQEREVSVFCCVPQFFYLVHDRVMGKVAESSKLVRTLFRSMLKLNGLMRDRLKINLGKVLFSKVHVVMGPAMRLLVTGGSRFDPAIGRTLYRLGFDIVQAYGLTETTGGVSVLRRGDRHVASVGQPLDGVEVKIVPTKSDAPAHEPPRKDAVRGAAATPIGEIVVRGPVVTPGYYNRPDANAEAFDGGWFRTGDLGYLDAKQRLYITGRAKEMIVTSSGKNIYPEEIEAHYLKAESIGELCVLGSSRDGEHAAERLHALIVPDFEALRRRKIVNSGELVRWDIETLSAQLPSHKRILSYDILKEPLPRTTTRKLKRIEIERRFVEGEYDSAANAAAEEQADDPAWLADPHVFRTLEAIRKSVKDPSKVWGKANLELDLGLDSMERVELLTEIEAGFGVRVEDDAAHQIYTVHDLVEAVRSSVKESDDGTAIEDAWPHILRRVDAGDPDVSAFFRSKGAAIALFVFLKFFYLLAWIFLGFRARGKEHLPASGPFLICPNHQSYIDGFLLAAALPFRVQRNVFIVGASEYFETELMAKIAGWVRLVPVDPDSNLTRAMRVGASGLRDGRVLMLFPEGERSIDGGVKNFKKGAAILASNVPAPIVPISIKGAYEVWPRSGTLRPLRLLPLVGRVVLSFGPPISFESPEDGKPVSYADRTRELRDGVVKLFEAD